MKSLKLSSPHIVVTVGIPGAGKTQFATAFAETFGAPLLSTDFFNNFSFKDTDRHAISLTILKEMLKTHQTIVLDGTTERRVWRSEIVKLARSAGYRVLFVWVQTDLATASSRWLKNNDNDQALLDSKLKSFSPPHPSETYVVISGKHTYSTQGRTVLKKLAETKPATRTEDIIPQRSLERQAVSNRINIG